MASSCATGNEYSIRVRLCRTVSPDTFHQIIVLWMLIIVSLGKSVLWWHRVENNSSTRIILDYLCRTVCKHFPNILSLQKPIWGNTFCFFRMDFFVSITQYLPQSPQQLYDLVMVSKKRKIKC